jgi:glycosyltransferase involved in cell wall biosynthesis
VCGTGSTGRICTEIADRLDKEGHEVKIAYGRNNLVPDTSRKYAVRIGNDFDVRIHGIKSLLFDAHGLGSVRSTKKFLLWAEEYNPDVVWLHNLHGYYINYELLFKWIKKHPEMEIRWTLHDCWSFTGHCAYFTMARCYKWKNECQKCPQPRKYPARLLIDRSKRNYQRKKDAFSGVERMTLITPSKWLASLVKESFMNTYDVEVMYNSINEEIFKPTKSDFRERYGITGRKMVLGVASPWDERKGLKDFAWLANHLDSQYVIVLVGLTSKQMAGLPANVICLKKTNSARELAEIYSAADVFVNPTHEDNYPTTNLEASACGTPVVTYRVGGSPESVMAQNVVDENDYEGLLERIVDITAERTK